jgi:hypothetical protein
MIVKFAYQGVGIIDGRELKIQRLSYPSITRQSHQVLQKSINWISKVLGGSESGRKNTHTHTHTYAYVTTHTHVHMDPHVQTWTQHHKSKEHKPQTTGSTYKTITPVFQTILHSTQHTICHQCPSTAYISQVSSKQDISNCFHPLYSIQV